MISKSLFKEYIRCPRYASLDQHRKKKDGAFLDAKEDLIGLINMFRDEEDFFEDVTDEQLEVMMPYFNELERQSALVAETYFPGKQTYSLNTKEQKYYERWNQNYQFSCYVDLHIEGNPTRIIETKATTTNKIAELAYTVDSVKYPIFEKRDNVYHLLPLPVEEKHAKGYQKQIAKLFDRYTPIGKYVFDLAIQRWIIDAAEPEVEHTYHLAVLNHEYIFDGTYTDGAPDYKQLNGEDIVSFVDLTEITKDYTQTIDALANTVETYLDELYADAVTLGKHCERKKTTQCRFYDLCYKEVPKKDSVFTYLSNHNGFKLLDEKGKTLDEIGPYDLINKGKTSMFDVPMDMLNRENNRVQRSVHETKDLYIYPKKVKDALSQIEFPIYHLDFESFPCPLPRYRGEKPYTQSVFQFSLHIQYEFYEPRELTKHIEFCSLNEGDDREALVKLMVESMGTKGSVLVWNEGFEKGRLKELANIFPEYHDELMAIRDRVFDLMIVFRGSSKFYEALGYEKEDAKQMNYYHYDLQGSYSIKKVLPIFSELTYQGMEVGNGMEAVITYARFPFMDDELKAFKYKSLLAYCEQDTWAMVEILNETKKMLR